MRRSYCYLLVGSLALAAASLAYCRTSMINPAIVNGDGNQMIIDSITSLSDLGEISADLDCISTKPGSDFRGGFIAMRDSTDTRVVKGNEGLTWVRTTEGLNVFEPNEDSLLMSLDWSNDNQSYTIWLANNGIEDVRVPLFMAAQQNCHKVAGQTAQGIPATMVVGDGLRLWFDDAKPTRLLKVEADFSDGSGLASETEFLNWTVFGNSEFPTETFTTNYFADGTVDADWHYRSYNVNTGFHLDESLFEFNDPAVPGSGGSGSGNNPPQQSVPGS